MADLFSDAAGERVSQLAPLAQRLRPRTIDEFVGQTHVLAPGSALRLAIEEDRVASSIFYGPPGSGKTTLARIVAGATGAEFEELSAVSATVAQVREVLARARERLGANGRRTILFLDEIHRFNKAQQDALLPAVEEGLVTLIGATTENPYYEVNSALISRTQVYELEPLAPEELAPIVRRGLQEVGGEASDEVVDLIVQRSGGDGR
ncbi:MAG TPA: AAA family ATPase, partial [Gaiellaceae bacterium]|nr:AAA family ATPase [Gaiellaceae bacterium]